MSNICTICNFISVFVVKQPNPNRQQSVLFSSFSEQNINFVGQLFKTNGPVKPWKQLQEEYGLANKLKINRIQLIHSSPKLWIE